MSSIIVITWPLKEIFLFNRGFMKTELKESVSINSGSLEIPVEWLKEAKELRVLCRGGFNRITEIAGASGSEAEDAAIYSIENTLPLPISSLVFAARTIKKRGGQRKLLVSALPAGNISELQNQLSKYQKEIFWIGTAPLAMSVKGDQCIYGADWAGVWKKGECIDIQSGLTGIDAKNVIDKRGKENLEWREINSLEEAEALVSAKDGSFKFEEETRDEKRFNFAALFAVIAFAILIFAFGLRYWSANKRINASEAAVGKIFAEAMPNTKMVSPIEQMRSERKELLTEFELIKNRVEKKGSALDWLIALGTCKQKDSFVIDDFRASGNSVTVIGSASSTDAIDEVTKILKEIGAVNQIEISDPEIRRSAQGMGLDFVYKGDKKNS